ncbi:hypothetical protein PH213_27185 [Streptomyces sp. SRF1]|uniref:hypothetical protein n=1 Tax=Streptomyces sp. SRF1 TaxID=1549642 RepID=UPI0025AFF851|nr:hypothetical protein [Streptomyces sp. SRF1]MDN3058180.1 hypothetical protein [Streptomyces sp. SRF1]
MAITMATAGTVRARRSITWARHSSSGGSSAFSAGRRAMSGGIRHRLSVKHIPGSGKPGR